MMVCGKSAADDTHCLDECSGYEAELEGVDDFKYRCALTACLESPYVDLHVAEQKGKHRYMVWYLYGSDDTQAIYDIRSLYVAF